MQFSKIRFPDNLKLGSFLCCPAHYILYMMTSVYLEGQADLAGHQFLHGGQHDGVADLLPFTVPLYLSVQGRRFPGLRVGVVWTHCVNLRCPETQHNPHTHRQNTHKHRKCLRVVWFLYFTNWTTVWFSMSLVHKSVQVIKHLHQWPSELAQYLHISTICGHELLIDVGSSLSYAAFWGVHAAATPNLQQRGTERERRGIHLESNL